MKQYITVLKKYAVFEGRATRSEYWYFTLVSLLVTLFLGVLDRSLVGSSFLGEESLGTLGSLYSLVVLAPSLAVSVRRLHDIGKSGYWLFIGFIPFIGILILFFNFVTDGEKGSNTYGSNPKELSSTTAPTIPNATA
jgi:uncharacterized membrane protein YhaH (DUF805 family)